MTRRIAVIGSGIAGNTAAFALGNGPARHEVTVYERERRPGGHCATVDIDYQGTPIAVDTGFIVYNELNYPNLTALLSYLNVATEPSDMSFAVSIDRGRLEWAGSEDKVLRGIFAQRRNLLSPRFLMFLAELVRFHGRARQALHGGQIPPVSLAEFVAGCGFSQRLLEDYLLPMGAAIWSSAQTDIRDFPAQSFLAFFDNHCLLQWGRPKWRTVTRGSRSYVEALVDHFRPRLRLAAPVVAVTRRADGVEIVDSTGGRDRFDQVIIATHAPQALAILTDPSPREREVLSRLRTTTNGLYLHRDPRLMPRRPAAWASWNVLRDGATTRSVAVTYWMNKLQTIDKRYPLFISLNPLVVPRTEMTFARFAYDHPQFDAAALAAQTELAAIQGVNRTFFCGAWSGYGFHEDGLVSGLAAAEALGGRVPWRQPPVDLPIAAE